MKKIIMMLVLSLLAINLVGCSPPPPPQQAYTENSSKIKVASKRIKEQCYDGVIYIRSGQGVSVKFNQDGSVATCYIVGN